MKTNENKLKILLVEDDENLGNLLSDYLLVKGHSPVRRNNGEEGLKAFEKEEFDLCILDVMMPVKDGFTLAKEIRLLNTKIPIIFLTAKSMKEDTIEGFRIGADDYITKPFSMEVLLYRIEAIMRRLGDKENDLRKRKEFEIGGFTFRPEKRLLENDGEVQKLTSKENELLRLLCINEGEVVERDAALKLIWGDDNYFNSRSMDVYITKLRKFFKGHDEIEIINVHGIGFKLLIDETK